MMSRNYRLEYLRDHSSFDAKKKRAMRNLWNRRLKGQVPEGFEIDHIRSLKNGGNNDRSNIRLRSISSNRSDKTMFKDASYYLGNDLEKTSGAVAAAIGAYAADRGIENKAKGAAAGATASWLATPLGAYLGNEYIRRNARDFNLSKEYSKGGMKAYKKIMKSPSRYMQQIGPKGAGILFASTALTGYPAAYIAGKTFGRGGEKVAALDVNTLRPIGELALDPRVQNGVMTLNSQIPDKYKIRAKSKIRKKSRQAHLSVLRFKRKLRQSVIGSKQNS
jgi:hypothetical protein